MRIEKPNSIVSVFADKPLESAVETATFNLMDWLIPEYNFTPTDAYCLVSTCQDFRINVYQMCKIAKLMYVAGAEIPTKYLGAKRWSDEFGDRLALRQDRHGAPAGVAGRLGQRD